MSIDAYRAVWSIREQVPLTATELLVALAIADHVPPGGSEAFPGLDRLGTMTGLDRRTIQRTLRRLESGAILTRIERSEGGRGRRTVFRLDIAKGGADAAVSSDADAPNGGAGTAVYSAEKGGTDTAVSRLDEKGGADDKGRHTEPERAAHRTQKGGTYARANQNRSESFGIDEKEPQPKAGNLSHDSDSGIDAVLDELMRVWPSDRHSDRPEHPERGDRSELRRLLAKKVRTDDDLRLIRDAVARLPGTWHGRDGDFVPSLRAWIGNPGWDDFGPTGTPDAPHLHEPAAPTSMPAPTRIGPAFKTDADFVTPDDRECDEPAPVAADGQTAGELLPRTGFWLDDAKLQAGRDRGLSEAETRRVWSAFVGDAARNRRRSLDWDGAWLRWLDEHGAPATPYSEVI